MDYLLGLNIAILAYTYAVILTDEKMIFNGLYNLLYKLFNTSERLSEGKNEHFIFLILIGCEKCFAGQFAFWIFLWANWSNYLNDFLNCFLYHIFFVSYTIFLTFIIKTIVNKHNNERA